MIAGIRGYDAAAEELAEQYEVLAFEEVHSDVLHLLPPPPGRVLDVGAGSGRDAAAMARSGHVVTAAEPAARLRAQGQRLHAAEEIAWVGDALPDMAGLDSTFDFILLSAVWIHLDEGERWQAIERLRSLLAPEGRLVITLRHGPVAADRRMFDVHPDETILMAEKCELELVHRGCRTDLLGRSAVSWTSLGFVRRLD